jgi:hypothetical protein
MTASGNMAGCYAAVDMAFLFEVNLHGVRGFGLGASAAIDNWIANADAAVVNDKKLMLTIQRPSPLE